MPDTNLLYGNEILIAAFGQFPRSHFRVVDENEIVCAFYKLARKPKFRDFFHNYVFDEDGLTPRSEALSEGLDTLQQSRLVGRMNPALVDYTIDPALEIRFKRHVKPKLQGKEKLLEELGKEIKGLLKITGPT